MKNTIRVTAIVLFAVALFAGGRPALAWGATPATHTIAVFGDPQEWEPTDPDLSAGFQFIVPFLAQTGADAAIGLGDYARVEDLTQAQTDVRYTTFLNEYDKTGIPRSNTVWVPGNHDCISDMVRTEWATLFGEPPDLHAWGLYQIDGIYVVQLETWAPGYDGYIGYYGEGDSRNSPQANWLVSTLKSLPPDAWVVVGNHIPVADSSEAMLDTGESPRLEALFAKYGVDLVLGGHDHDYRRHMDPSGIPYITDGMAGGPPGPTNIPPNDSHDIVVFSGEGYHPTAYGYMTIQFDGAAMHVTAYEAQLGATVMLPLDSFDVGNRASSALPTLTFASPAGGENWLAGTPQTVSWTLSSALSSGQFRIYFADAANAWSTLKSFTPTPGQTDYSNVPVTLPAKPAPGSTCRIWVYWRSDPTVNTWQLSAKSAAFTVTALPTLTFASPAGGENWLAGTPQTVSWTLSSALSSGQFRIYFADAANAWSTLKSFTPTPGQTDYSNVPVTLPAKPAPGSTCRIWVYWRSDPTVNTWQLSAKSAAFTVS